MSSWGQAIIAFPRMRTLSILKKLSVCLNTGRLARRVPDRAIHLVADQDENDVGNDLQQNQSRPKIEIFKQRANIIQWKVLI